MQNKTTFSNFFAFVLKSAYHQKLNRYGGATMTKFYAYNVRQIKFISLPDTQSKVKSQMPLQIGIGVSATAWYLHGGHVEDLQLFVDWRGWALHLDPPVLLWTAVAIGRQGQGSI